MNNYLMSKFLMGAFSILFLVIVGELLFLNLVTKQITQKVSPIPNTTMQFPYEQNEIKTSGGDFMKILRSAKKIGYSLSDLSWYLQGAVMTKKPMIEQYLITATAQGKVTNIINNPTDGMQITLQDSQNTGEIIIYKYLPSELKKVQIVLKSGKQGDISNLVTGDKIKISDTVDMKTVTNTKALIEIL